MKDELRSKIILITGSSRGIGRETARIASKHYGAKVILHGKTRSGQLEKLAEELNAEYIACDTGDKKAVITTVNDIIKKTGRIDGLINSAGIVRPKPFLETGDEDWIEEYRTNLLGVVHFCQAVIPQMKKQKYGRIANVSSIRGIPPLASNRGISYSASKAAVINLTSSLAKEYAPYITVNSVAPGFINTDITQFWNDKVWQQAKTSLAERIGEPSDIAEALLFLVSDRASFITGQTIVVDGGYSLSGK